MNTAQRLHIIRIITKIDNNPDFSKKIGVKNTSTFKPEKNNSKKVAAGKWTGRRRYHVNVIIYHLFNRIYGKVLHLRTESILGNPEITLLRHLFSSDPDRNGGRRINLPGPANSDYRRNHRIACRWSLISKKNPSGLETSNRQIEVWFLNVESLEGSFLF